MNPLPDTLTSVVVPDQFRSSLVALAIDCRLQMLLEHAAPDVPRLGNRGLGAQRGLLFHRLIEDSGKGRVVRRGELEDDLRYHLAQIAEDILPATCSDIQSNALERCGAGMTPLMWRQFIRWNLDIATRVYCSRNKETGHEMHKDSSRIPLRSSLKYDELSHQGQWHEVDIGNAKYRLNGRIDFVEKRSDGFVRLIDYKTGRAVDRDGSITPRVRLQLLLYALMVREVEPEATLQLGVEGRGVTKFLEFTAGDLQEVVSRLEALSNDLPANSHVSCEDVSSVGLHCERCGYRHVCGRYLREAPPMWTEIVETSGVRLDVWGTVVASETIGVTSNITIRDAIGRKVKVFGLQNAKCSLEEFALGRQVYFFNLVSGSVRQSVRRSAPRNYYVPSQPEETATCHPFVFDGIGRVLEQAGPEGA